MHICSLLPSATEILYALGLGDSVVGVTHECDFPPEVAKKPLLIRPRVDSHAGFSEIDRQICDLVARGESIYTLDAELLASLSPDLVVTQDLCQVCAASPDDLPAALTRLSKPPQVLSLSPHSLADVWNDVRRVGCATGCSREAEAVAIELEQRVSAIESKTAHARCRPRVLCLEWLEPFYIAGHWVPEMVARAGGEDVMGRAGEPSFRVTVEEIVAVKPDVIVLMPCGFNLSRIVSDFSAAQIAAEWSDLPAVRDRCIYGVDANGYFSRPGPRLADGVELLAHIFHPNLVTLTSRTGSFRRL